jgi:hypothetical protein
MGGTFVSEPVAFISADDALALLRAAGHNAQRSPARGRCRTLCYLVGGQYVNLGRLRQMAAELSPAPAAPAEPVALAPVAAEPVATPQPLSPAAVVALLCRKFPVSTPATYQPAVARLQARGAAVTPLSVLQELNRPAPAEPAAPVAAEPAPVAAEPAPVAPEGGLMLTGSRTAAPGRPYLAGDGVTLWAFETEAQARAAAAAIAATGAEPYLAGPGPMGRPVPLAPVAAEPARRRPLLPGEAQPPAAPAPHGAAAPTLPSLRADAAAGRPVSLAALAAAITAERPAPTGEGLAGQPWDPGTPAARAAAALQGERVGILWPISQALRGEGVALPPAWQHGGPVMDGTVPLARALAALPLGAIATAAAALAALPPVTPAQDAALAACRTGAVPGRPYL